jgi:hypothetical protein
MTTTAASSTAQGNLDNVTSGGAALVDWELYGTRITPASLRAAMVAHGYDPALIPDIDQDQRVRSAGAKWTQGRGNADRYRAEVTEDDDAIYVQILRRGDSGTVGSAGKAARRKFAPVASLVWTKTLPALPASPAVPGSWAPDVWWHQGQQVQAPVDDGVRAAVNACRKACDNARLHHDHELIRPVCVQAPLRSMGAVPFIRRSGGAMVVPMQNWNDLKRLQSFVGSIGDSYMGVVRADVSDKGTVQAMQRSVRDSLTTDVRKVRDDLQAWRDRGNRISSAAVGDRLKTFAAIRDRAQLYADSLGMVVADLLADIDGAEGDARDLLDVAMGRKRIEEVQAKHAAQADGPDDATLAKAAADLSATGSATIPVEAQADDAPTGDDDTPGPGGSYAVPGLASVI